MHRLGTSESRVLGILEKIELHEGLPQTTINGEWVKRSREANKPYLITTFTEESNDPAWIIVKNWDTIHCIMSILSKTGGILS